MRRQEKKLISNNVELMQPKGENRLDISFHLPCANFPTFGKPVNVFLTTVKIVRKFHAFDDCINP